MKTIGYIIYIFWDFKTRIGDEGEWETNTCNPHPEYKKRIYSDLASAEDAVQQMKKTDFHNTSYHILPIFTPQEQYDKIIEAYKQRTKA